MIYRSLSILCFLFSSIAVNAQTDNPEMADMMRANGKIYVVVAVMSIVFAGIVIYLIRLDLKIARLERESHHQNQR